MSLLLFSLDDDQTRSSAIAIERHWRTQLKLGTLVFISVTEVMAITRDPMIQVYQTDAYQC